MLKEIVKEALISLGRNRTRSSLTLLGMAWGVACFVILFAWGDGFARALDLGMAYFGDTVTIVWNGQTSKQAGGEKAGRRIQMELVDVESVREQATLVRRVSPEFYDTFPIQSRRRLTNQGVRGTNEHYAAMRGHFLDEGRHFNGEDVQYARRVVVLGKGLRDMLFSGAPAVGEDIRIGGIPFTVIGVLRKKVSMSNYFGMDDEHGFIPYTAMGALKSIRHLSVLVVQPVSLAMEEKAMMQVREILGENHRFQADDDRALIMQTWGETHSIINGIVVGMKIFLLVMGALTLGIGGIGLMNVMLVSVAERTREVGIRKALGARRRHILMQFLFESLVIAGLGGVLGYALSHGVSLGVGSIPFWSALMEDASGQADIQLLISPSAVFTSLAALGLVAVVSGFFPALRASRLAPIEALRHE